MTTTETASDLRSETHGGILTLTLNRPEALNALTPALLKNLHKALRDAEKDNAVRVIVLTGAGRAFCAGADLAALNARGNIGLGDDLRELFNPVIKQLRKIEKPVVAAINGVAAGAGASLAFACDLKVAASDMKFHLAFMKVGLAPDSGMSWFLTRGLNLSEALEHAWLGEAITAERALHVGLVNKLVTSENVLVDARILAKKLAELPPLAAALTKRSLNKAANAELEHQLEYEAQVQDVLGRTADHKEGVAAFLAKRAPKFTGA